jgi:hypothetical protein
MAKQKPHSIFGTGPLATPLPPLRFGDIFELPGAESPRSKLIGEKFALLCQHYGLDPKMLGQHFWPKLASSLMLDLVPGFREAKPNVRGRPKKTKRAEYIDMLFDLTMRARELKRRHPNFSKAAICGAIRKQIERERDKTHPLYGKSDKTFVRTLDEALAAASRVREYQLPAFPLPPRQGAMGFGSPRPPDDTLDRGLFGLAAAELGFGILLKPQRRRLVRAMMLDPANPREGSDKNSAPISVLESETDKN